MVYVLSLGDAEACQPTLTGGKGASLAAAARSGFPVPAAFVVTTDTYREATGPLAATVEDLIAQIDFDDSESIANGSAKIRDAIASAKLPDDAVREIFDQYAVMDGGRVAVRSSGTAEDLSQASFAGQHDTFLNVVGPEQVLDQIKSCWVSMWSDRVVAYRHERGLDQPALAMAVVVQEMVPAAVSGVMFTANPVTAATNEIVINSSWGLGESVVAGTVAPDHFVLDRDSARVKERTIGGKATRLVMNGESGLVEEAVSAADQAAPTLSDEQLEELARIGRQITEQRGGWPQDIEWALAEDTFHVLQTRDITGAEFSWDEDLEDYTDLPPIPDDAIITSTWSEAAWNGAVTPLFYSIRADEFTRCHRDGHRLWGSPEIGKMRQFRYHKAEVMFNCEVELRRYASLVPPPFRSAAMLENVPADMSVELDKIPGSKLDVFKVYSRIRMLDPELGLNRNFRTLYDHIDNRAQEAMGLERSQLRTLTDSELVRYVNSRVDYMAEWVGDEWTMFYVHITYVMGALIWILQHWYDGANPLIFGDLITGLPRPTITVKENMALWDLAQTIKKSPVLTTLFNEHEGAAFFDAVADAAVAEPEAAEFREQYTAFVAEYGHRGHADRDIYFARRIDNPAQDYVTFKSLMTADSVHPSEVEQRLVRQREAATAEVIASIEKRPFGALKREVFKALHDYALKFFVFRDDQRGHCDRITWSKKCAVDEVGRRLRERGILAGAEDHYFLSKNELLTTFRTGNADRLIQAKIAGRRRNFERYQTEWFPPKYMRGNRAISQDSSPQAGGGERDGNLHQGVPTSRGKATGIARVIHSQHDLGRVQKGDILVASSTDPGWTPVFLVLSGSVFQTGGMLAHCACISREYGIPSVMLSDAMNVIRDGSLICVDGETGTVEVVADPDGAG